MIYKIVYLLGLAIISVIRLRYAGVSRETAVLNRVTRADKFLQFTSGLGLTVIPLLYIFTSWLDFADMPFSQVILEGAGLIGSCFLIAAIIITWRAQHDLGRNWTAAVQIKKDQTLVTTGIYRIVRHPLYAANMLWGIAQMLLLPNWIAGPVMLVTFIPFSLVRVKQEERMLLEHFGEQYRTYCIQTARFLPWRH